MIHQYIYDIAQVDPPRDLRSWGSQPPIQGGESWLLPQLQGWDESGKPQHPWPSVQHLFRSPSSLRPGCMLSLQVSLPNKVQVLNSGILVIDQIQICSIQQDIEIYYTQCSYTCEYVLTIVDITLPLGGYQFEYKGKIILNTNIS